MHDHLECPKLAGIKEESPLRKGLQGQSDDLDFSVHLHESRLLIAQPEHQVHQDSEQDVVEEDVDAVLPAAAGLQEEGVADGVAVGRVRPGPLLVDPGHERGRHGVHVRDGHVHHGDGVRAVAIASNV